MNLANFRNFGRKILCFGRTYKAHALELNNPIPQEPIVFLKPTTSYISHGESIQMPKGCSELHHEVELGLVVCSKGRNILESKALDYIGGYVLALDMTDRTAQLKAKKDALPWSLAKGFDTACPVSSLIPKGQIPDPQNVNLWLKVNQELRQQANTSEMSYSIPYLISWVSQYFTLEPGDLILTGTPSGVGPVKQGDLVECGLDEILTMSFPVEEE